MQDVLDCQSARLSSQRYSTLQKKKKSNLKIRLLSLLLYEFVKLFTSRTTTIIFIFTNKINKFGGFFVQFISYLLVKKSGKFKYNL